MPAARLQSILQSAWSVNLRGRASALLSSRLSALAFPDRCRPIRHAAAAQAAAMDTVRPPSASGPARLGRLPPAGGVLRPRRGARTSPSRPLPLARLLGFLARGGPDMLRDRPSYSSSPPTCSTYQPLKSCPAALLERPLFSATSLQAETFTRPCAASKQLQTHRLGNTVHSLTERRLEEPQRPRRRHGSVPPTEVTRVRMCGGWRA